MHHKLKKIILLLSLSISAGVAVTIAVQEARAEKVEVGMEQSKQLFEDLKRWKQSNEQVEQEKEAHAYYVERQQAAQASKRAEEKELARAAAEAAAQAEQAASYREEQETQAVAEQERLNKEAASAAEAPAEPSAQQATVGVETHSGVDAGTPAPAFEPQVVGVNKIGVNGIYKNYVSIGFADTGTIQSVIDTGAITAALTYFSGTDGQSTYFGGHNPGVMNFMESNATIGSVITVTDANGAVFEYVLTDRVQTDTTGEAVFGTIGMSAVDAYGYGTGAESILIQYCNSYDSLMTMWYGVLL